MTKDEYLRLMMQVDPTTAPVQTQVATANALRGMMDVGAAGSTSQIAEISGTGKGAMEAGIGMGRQMGLDKAKRLDREAADARNAADNEARLRSANRLAAARTAKTSQPDYTNLTKTERENLMGLKGDIQTIRGLYESFDDSYANQEGIGFVEGMIQQGMTDEPNLTNWTLETWDKAAKYLGMEGRSKEEAEGLKRKLMKEQQWWGLYERLQKIPERAAMFGATLTTNEMNSWNQADIKEGMTPEQIRNNLMVRLKIAEKKFNQIVDMYAPITNPEFIAGLRNTDEIDMGTIMRDTFDEVNPVEGAEPEAAAMDSNGVPAGVDPAEWEALPPEYQQFYLENPDMFNEP